MKIVMLLVCIMLSLPVVADIHDCGYSKVGVLYAIGSRSSNNANRLQVALPSGCAPKPFGFVDNDDPSYQGILALLLAAKMSDKPIRIVVDDSVSTHNSVRIEWVNFE